MIGGLAVALGAACCYETAYVLQALEARRAGSGAVLQPALLGRLVRRPAWLAGMALTGVGAALQVLALSLAPLSVVQPTLALGLVLLLALSVTVLGERVGRRELAGVAAIVCGVAAVALLAPPEAGNRGDATATAALAALLGIPTLLPFVLRDRACDARVRVLAAASGDVLAVIGLKLAAGALDRGDVPLAAVYAGGAAGAGLLALTAEMNALQRLAATRVAPVVLAAQVLVPVLAGPLAFGEAWTGTRLGDAALALAIATVAGGAALLGASHAVAGVLAGGGEDRLPSAAAAGQPEYDVGRERQPREGGDG